MFTVNNNMDANDVFSRFGHSKIEVRFMENTESYKKYGHKVGGNIHSTDDKFTEIITPHSINISEGLMSNSLNHRASIIKLAVNVGCKRIYNISDEKAELLLTEGFSVFDVEPNGIEEI